MPELTLLAVFIPTWFFISITPGMCMTLAMTLGMSIGVKRTMWMMLGEVFGVASVAILSVIGVAAMMLNYPVLFTWFKWLGGGYLFYLGVKMWLAKGDLSQESINKHQLTRVSLMSQGYITAVANPKGWAFMISILPPFISVEKPIAVQFIILLIIIMLSEFISMLIYASGGKGLKRVLSHSNNVIWLNRIAGSLLAAVGVWLALS